MISINSSSPLDEDGLNGIRVSDLPPSRKGKASSDITAISECRSGVHISLPKFRHLSVGTDIQVAPANWLTKGTYFQSPSTNEMTCGSLVGTVDLSDQIDFIAPVENMKALFMLPYSEKSVSLGIHRLGNSLLILSACYLILVGGHFVKQLIIHFNWR